MPELTLINPDWGLAAPQLVVFVTTMALLLLDAFLPHERHYGVLTGVSLAGYAIALLAFFAQRDTAESTFYGLFRADGLTLFLSVIILVAAILTVMISASYV
ncbi:MAG: NADH-quinone oxidoreductase subunit N, partial [Chloroflexota bacterium]|nr:NADH-quinone oxidoreductase subunit N [Chloroflexota bacterium]